MIRRVAVAVLVAIAFVAEVGRAQVTTSAVPFLLIAPNSRASGMGETGVALADDAWAQFWNPAGYAFQHGSELSMSHANWLPGFGLSDLWIAHMVYKMEIEELAGTVSAGLTYLNLGTFNRRDAANNDLGTFKGYEFAVVAGYATALSKQVGIGVNGRFIYSRLAPFGTAQEEGTGVASGVSFDFGLLYKPEFLWFTDIDLKQRFSLGFNLSNVGPAMTYIDEAQSDPLPMNFRFGLAYNLVLDEYNNFIVTADFNKLLISRDSSGTDPFYEAIFSAWGDKSLSEEMREFTTGLGLEYWYNKLIALRVGYFYEDPEFGNRKFMTFGAGIRYDMYGFDFSYISAFEERHPLGETLRFTLVLAWGGKQP